MAPKVAIVFYSLYGHIQQLAEAEKEGLKKAGIEADLFQVPETLPKEVLTKMHAPPKSNIPTIDPATLATYDAFLFGIPTRYGNFPAQWKAFWDATGSQWQTGGEHRARVALHARPPRHHLRAAGLRPLVRPAGQHHRGARRLAVGRRILCCRRRIPSTIPPRARARDHPRRGIRPRHRQGELCVTRWLCDNDDDDDSKREGSAKARKGRNDERWSSEPEPADQWENGGRASRGRGEG
ncbi:hypothetical protein EYC84_002762 [Monilinia fructicola]|uniref:Flavodoxin-like domain-containing protein n=1 Tax=Monilinia fructicola TaxID=38448 RepID=A0A5M9JMK9_MONFR|nr:hypothetical protein EYC84_002762 [Monilinia fructicola]